MICFLRHSNLTTPTIWRRRNNKSLMSVLKFSYIFKTKTLLLHRNLTKVRSQQQQQEHWNANIWSNIASNRVLSLKYLLEGYFLSKGIIIKFSIQYLFSQHMKCVGIIPIFQIICLKPGPISVHKLCYDKQMLYMCSSSSISTKSWNFNQNTNEKRCFPFFS